MITLVHVSGVTFEMALA